MLRRVFIANGNTYFFTFWAGFQMLPHWAEKSQVVFSLPEFRSKGNIDNINIYIYIYINKNIIYILILILVLLFNLPPLFLLTLSQKFLNTWWNWVNYWNILPFSNIWINSLFPEESLKKCKDLSFITFIFFYRIGHIPKRKHVIVAVFPLESNWSTPKTSPNSPNWNFFQLLPNFVNPNLAKCSPNWALIDMNR